MNSPLAKIKNTLDFHYFSYINGWHFPQNTAYTSGARMAKGTHEPQVSKVLKNQLHSGSLFLDVGANIGYFERLASEIVEDGHIFAFEADYNNYYSLCNNTSSLHNVTPVNFAVYNKNSALELFRSSHSSCHSMEKTEYYQTGDKISVPTITLDLFWDLYLEKSVIDLIKIDVEGAEIRVLEGMKNIVDQNCINVIILECCPKMLVNSKHNPGDIFDILDPDFNISAIENEYEQFQSNGEIRSIDEFQDIVDYLFNLDDTEHVNLLCKHK